MATLGSVASTGGTRPGPTQLAAWRAFLRAHARVVEILDEELRAAHDLPLTWYDALVQLSEAGGRLRMSELADALLLSRSNCTRLVDRMQVAGLIDRAQDAGPDTDTADSRARWAVLTTAGRRRLADAAPTHLAGVERYLTSHLDEAAALVVADRLDRAATSAEDALAAARVSPAARARPRNAATGRRTP